MYHFSTRQKSLIDSLVATGLLYKQTNEHAHQWLLGSVEQMTGCVAEQKQAVQPLVQYSSDNGSVGIDRRRYYHSSSRCINENLAMT